MISPQLSIYNISNRYTVTVSNKFDALKEISECHSSNDEYENFVTAHLQAATEYISIKTKSQI